MNVDVLLFAKSTPFTTKPGLNFDQMCFSYVSSDGWGLVTII